MDKAFSSSFEFSPIGVLSTCFKQKFGIPRQGGLVASAPGILKLRSDPHFKTALQGIEGFSHIWLIFVFHERNAENWKPSVRPPRLGGAKKMGVLATRSPHRPNPIGISVAKLEKIDYNVKGGIEIHLSGVDCLDQTPILDIKPYLSYADSLPTAKTGWAHDEIERIPVLFSKDSILWAKTHVENKYPNFLTLAKDILELDPRPAFQKKKFPPRQASVQYLEFGFQLYEYNLTWIIQEGTFFVTCIEEFSEEKHSSLARSKKSSE